MRERGAMARRGFSLIIVLGSIVLVSTLVVAYLAAVQIDLRSSKSYAQSTEVRMLADSAVNLTIAQIQQATTAPGIAWSSQPGLIRTYTSAGAPGPAYKLYSADPMVTAGALAPAADLPPASWSGSPAFYTDLNQAAKDRSGIDRYPILDPPSNIPGYSILTGSLNPSNFSSPVMPVRWMYVLRGGQLVVPTGSGNVATIPGASAANPIVGRIAFWADDDTCKINLNTAAGDQWNAPALNGFTGSFWDTPRLATFEDYSLADRQPQLNEFQRFPGHPATVYLSAAFPTLTRDELFKIIPRIQTGGSDGGTKTGVNAAGKVIINTSQATVTLDGNRLYSTVDELMFSQARGTQGLTKDHIEKAKFFLTAHSRAPEVNLFGLPRLAIWPIHTAPLNNSVSTPFDRLIAFCSSLPSASGPPTPYYFQRQNSASPTEDYAAISRNQELYSYLQRQTSEPVPGFGGNFLAKYGPDRDQILTEIVDYIRCTNLFDDYLIKQNRNGYPNSPSAYPTGNFTYTAQRTDVSEADPGHGQVAPLKIGNTQGFGRFPTVSEAGLIFICTADGDTDDLASTNPAKQQLHKDSNQLANKSLTSLLTETQRRVQALFFLELFTPGQGYPMIDEDLQIRVRGLDQFTLDGQPLEFPADAIVRMRGATVTHGRSWGGPGGIRPLIAGDKTGGTAGSGNDKNYNGPYRRRAPARGSIPADQGLDADNIYPFISIPVTVTHNSSRDPGDDKVTMDFSSSGGRVVTVEIYAGRESAPTGANLVQTLKIELPPAVIPIPKLVNDAATAPNVSPEMWWTFARDGIGLKGQKGRLYYAVDNPGQEDKPSRGAVLREEDVVRSVVPHHGDYRLLAASSAVPAGAFVPHPDYSDNSVWHAHYLREGERANTYIGFNQSGIYVSGAAYHKETRPDAPGDLTSTTLIATTQDFDNGFADVVDGPYVNLPDGGSQYRALSGSEYTVPYYGRSTTQGAGGDAIFQSAGGATFFSPNRQVPSPGMFGSLSTGVKANIPWKTLLFRPDAAHPSSSPNIPDHLVMDLFWMPVVEPYAISEPFSTAGKINLNYQLVPFTHIERSTALHAAMKSERVLAIPTSLAAEYKNQNFQNATCRHPIALGTSQPASTHTLSQFMDRFANASKGYAFRSATEICDLHLVPQGQTASSMPAFWDNHRLTGDNSKERPYANLYQKLTTKSNTFTVHFRVQTLQKVKTDAQQDRWKEGVDVVTGEYRGATAIERFIDPNRDFPDFAAAGTTQTADDFYQWRVLHTKRFNP